MNRLGKDTTDAMVGFTVCNKKLLPDLYFHLKLLNKDYLQSALNIETQC